MIIKNMTLKGIGSSLMYAEDSVVAACFGGYRELLLRYTYGPASELFAKIVDGELGPKIKEVLLASGSADEQKIGKRIWPHLQENKDRKLWLSVTQDPQMSEFFGLVCDGAFGGGAAEALAKVSDPVVKEFLVAVTPELND